jgi:hypothetical protein
MFRFPMMANAAYELLSRCGFGSDDHYNRFRHMHGSGFDGDGA